MSETKIEWAEETVNPFTGCSKVSPGCDNCYALRMAWRLAHNNNPKISDKYKGTVEKVDGKVRWTGTINFDVDLSCIDKLYDGRKGKVVFVGSMGDIGHENLSYDRFSMIMSRCYSINNHRIHYSNDKKEPHRFLFLTKRPARFGALWEMYFKANDIKENWPRWESWPLHDDVYSTFWIGVTAENQEQADARIPVLLSIPAAKRFVSIEPMLGPVELDNIECKPGYFENALSLEEWAGAEDSPEVKASMGGGALLDWVICGGESGPGARPVHPEWVRGVRAQCDVYGVPFFFKQWGEWAEDKQHGLATTSVRACKFQDGTLVERVGKKAVGRMLDGKEYLEWPE